MKLSILDQAPISEGQSAKEALEMTIELAKLGDTLAYERYWLAEHHAFTGFASPQPSVMLSRIGAETERIRIGSGAVLLPYYKPLLVAESYHILQTLYPDRVDLGIGRAPGGSAEVSMALSDNYLKKVREYETDLEKLIHFLHQSFPEGHAFNKINPMPKPDSPPEVWILGTSEKSAELAARKGLAYCFGEFMTDIDGPQTVQLYRQQFTPKTIARPHVMVALNVVCAETTEAAHNIAMSQIIWKIKQERHLTEEKLPSVQQAKNYHMSAAEKTRAEQMKEKIIIGNPEQVVQKLSEIKASYQADELILLSLIHDKALKLKSYRLIKEAID